MSRPLEGVRVVVTRPADKSENLARLLRAQGAQVLLFPTIAIADPGSWDDLDAALERLQRGDYEWTIFTSVNAVEKLLGRASSERALGKSKIAAVGATTSAALRDRGVVVDLVPQEFTGGALADALGSGSGEVLLPRVEGAPRAIVAALTACGWDVDEVVAYRNVLPATADPEGLSRGFDVVTFASGSAARNFATLTDRDLQEPNPDQRWIVACIGPGTAQAARAAGLRVDVVADVHTDEGLVDALAAHFRSAIND